MSNIICCVNLSPHASPTIFNCQESNLMCIKNISKSKFTFLIYAETIFAIKKNYLWSFDLGTKIKSCQDFVSKSPRQKKVRALLYRIFFPKTQLVFLFSSKKPPTSFFLSEQLKVIGQKGVILLSFFSDN